MDELSQLGLSKYLFNGLYDTFYPSKTIGFTIFYKFSHLIGWNAKSIILTGRVQTLMIGLCTLLVIYKICRYTGQKHLNSALTVIFILCFSTFIERIFRIRGDQIALFFAATSLLVIIRNNSPSARAIVASGVFAGLAFLNTQKAIYLNIAVGMALIGPSIMKVAIGDAFRKGSLLVVGWTIPVCLYAVIFGADDFGKIITTIFLGPVQNATSGHVYYANLSTFVFQTLGRNLPLYIAAIAGLFYASRHILTLPANKQALLLYTWVNGLLVFTHNQPWPYVFLFSIPFLAIWINEGIQYLAKLRSFKSLPAVFLLLVMALSLIRNVHYSQHNNAEELMVIEQAERLLAPEQTYFDGIGMLPNRFEAPRVWLDARQVFLTNTMGGEPNLLEALRASPPDLIIKTYRTERIAGVLSPFLANSYVDISPSLMLPGQKLEPGLPTPFRAPVSGTYQVYNEQGEVVEASVIVNGEALMTPLTLPVGDYSLAVTEANQTLFLLPARKNYAPIVSTPKTKPIFENVYSF